MKWRVSVACPWQIKYMTLRFLKSPIYIPKKLDKWMKIVIRTFFCFCFSLFVSKYHPIQRRDSISRPIASETIPLDHAGRALLGNVFNNYLHMYIRAQRWFFHDIDVRIFLKITHVTLHVRYIYIYIWIFKDFENKKSNM
jgi:hypothetical protein